MTIQIAPSILAADFARLGDEVRAIVDAGCDYVHVDVMDGHFVPNLTIGPQVVQALSKVTTCPLDVHLMIEAPDRFLEAFARAGAHIITVHAEACPHLHRTLQAIHALGKLAGVCLNPGTPIAALDWVLELADLVLVMSVNPGFGGQTFIESSVDKIRAVRSLVDRAGRKTLIEVDGGIVIENAAKVANAGADILVSGTGIFAQADFGDAIRRMRAMALTAC